MGPRPYSERSSLPSDGPADTITAEIATGQAAADSPSPPTQSAATTPSPVPLDASTDTPTADAVPIVEEAAQNQGAAHPFFPAAGDGMPYDHALPGFLRQITNQQNLSSVHSLSIRVISRMTSLTRMSFYTPNLRELNLEGSMLGSLRDIGCNLKYLQVLRVGHCQLDSLDGTFGLSSLKELYAQRNLITDVTPCANLPHIRHIDVSRNQIRTLSSAGFLTLCPKLRSMLLEGNPAAQAEGYRDQVRRLLPQLDTLDNLSFRNEDNCTQPELIEPSADTSDTGSVDWGDYGLTPRSSSSGRAMSEEGEGGGTAAAAEAFEEEDFEVQQVLSQPGEDDLLEEDLFELRLDECEEEASSPGLLELAKLTDNKNCNVKAGYAAKTTRIQKMDKDIENRCKKSNLQLEAGAGSGGPQGERVEPLGHRRQDPASPGPEGPSTNSSVLVQGCKERQPRPSTAIGTRASAEAAQWGAVPLRPCTASPETHAPSTTSLEGELGVTKLTSGMPVCGNLTAALRNRKKHLQNAWEDDAPRSRRPEPLILLPKERGSEGDAGASGDGSGDFAAPSNEEDMMDEDVLAASKKWREAFRRFRSNNRARWEEEDNMDYSTLMGASSEAQQRGEEEGD